VRTSFGAEIIERKQAGLALVKYLRRKFQVAVALDLDVRDGVFVDFFGKQACTSDGVARVAMAMHVPVVPAFMVREGESPRHRITVLPLLDLVTSGDREECARENTQRMTTAIETMIRRHPDHWNWIHRRWKTRPEGEPRFY
jgi:Kdo2-lipid IVA lauroyltransferase/acyltransferase